MGDGRKTGRRPMGVDKKSMFGGDTLEEVKENHSRERGQHKSRGWRGEQRSCMSGRVWTSSWGLEKPHTGFKNNVIRSGFQSIILSTVKNTVKGRRLKQRDHLEEMIMKQ